MARLLFFVSIVLKILMFRDAVRRGVPTHWFWLIALLPFGEVIYFFVYPFDDPRIRRKIFGGEREKSADPPKVHEKMLRACELYDAGEYEAAEQELEALLRHTETHKAALYLLAKTRLQLDEPLGASRLLKRLVDIKPGYDDHGAWLLWAHALREADDDEEAIKQLRALVERAPKLKHWVILAEYLATAGRAEHARNILHRCRNRTGDPLWTERRQRLVDRLQTA